MNLWDIHNKNRDRELELNVEDAVFRKLQDSGWSVTKLDSRTISAPGGRKLLEWDGILKAKHEESSRNVLIVIETKQIFTSKKFDDFKERFATMKKAMENENDEYAALLPFKNHELRGVIGSPVIQPGLATSDFSYVTAKIDQFEAFLNI